jgi:hypothetical protein
MFGLRCRLAGWKAGCWRVRLQEDGFAPFRRLEDLWPEGPEEEFFAHFRSGHGRQWQMLAVGGVKC